LGGLGVSTPQSFFEPQFQVDNGPTPKVIFPQFSHCIIYLHINAYLYMFIYVCEYIDIYIIFSVYLDILPYQQRPCCKNYLNISILVLILTTKCFFSVFLLQLLTSFCLYFCNVGVERTLERTVFVNR
jgi:hypothetical protein